MSLADEAREMREKIRARLRELEPLAREYEELRRVAADMGIEPTSTPAQVPRRSATAPARRRRAATERTRAPSRSAPSAGELNERVLEAVRAEPGKTLVQYAEMLGVSQSALYRPVRELTNERAIVKRARQLFTE
jgi:hypothetical protein